MILLGEKFDDLVVPAILGVCNYELEDKPGIPGRHDGWLALIRIEGKVGGGV